ncbi:calcium-activated chloride channel regulator 1-like isoform X1 [Styela clava]
MIMNYLPSGSRIGIVEFSSNADILSYLKTIETQNDREDFVNLLPTITQDFTSIGDGLLKGIEVLEYGGESAAGGNLIVLVDGKENEPNFVDMMFDSIVGKGVHVSTIYYDETDGGREKGLQQLITETGGKWVFVADENDLNSLTNAFITMVQPEDGDTTAQVLTIESYEVSIPSGAYQSSVYLDQTIGKNTVFSFSWNSGNPDLSVRLQSPDGCEFTHSSIGPTSNCGNTVSSEAKGFNTISFNISGIAKEGNWKYIIEPSFGSKVNIQISSSAADQDVEPIMITPFLTTSESSSVKVLRAKVSKGLLPIAGVNVVAKISKPDKSVVTIDLLDNGAGADQKMDDGIYSKSLTDITTINGRYSVKIEATASGTSAKINGNTMSFANYNYGVVLDDGSVKLNPNGLPDSVESNSISVTEFSRSLSMVGFTHSGASGGPDNISPCKIIDLEIKQATESTNKIDILFTAPGNDYDVGNAFYYEMFYTFEASTDLLNLGQSRNETTRVVLEDDFLQGSLKSPKKFGEIETMRLALVSVPTIEGFYTVSLVVRSADLEGNVSPISNIAATEYVVGKPVVIATSTNSVFSTSIKVTPVSKSTSIPSKPEPSNGLIIGLSVSIVIIVISVVAVLLWLCKRHNRKKAVSPRERVYQPSEYDKATDLPRECPPDYSTVNAPYQQPSYRYEAYQRQPYYQTNDYEFAQTNQSAYETPIQQQYYEDVDNAPPLPPRPPNRG